jgi:hypothetical protein
MVGIHALSIAKFGAKTMSKPKRRPADPSGSRRLLNAADHFPSLEAFMRTKICYKSRL